MPSGIYKKTEEHKQRISKAHKGKKHPHTKETKRKLSEIKKGGKHSEETKKKIGLSHLGKHYKKWTEASRMKSRQSAFEYAKRIAGIICPRIGRNEKQILDELEQELKYKILRQFKCEGYFIDGYIPELKLAIEVDEIPKNREKDIVREKIIEEKLSCKFLRIKDYD